VHSAVLPAVTPDSPTPFFARLGRAVVSLIFAFLLG
jgi:hypothetical protein